MKTPRQVEITEARAVFSLPSTCLGCTIRCAHAQSVNRVRGVSIQLQTKRYCMTPEIIVDRVSQQIGMLKIGLPPIVHPCGHVPQTIMTRGTRIPGLELVVSKARGRGAEHLKGHPPPILGTNTRIPITVGTTQTRDIPPILAPDQAVNRLIGVPEMTGDLRGMTLTLQIRLPSHPKTATMMKGTSIGFVRTAAGMPRRSGKDSTCGTGKDVLKRRSRKK